MENCWGEESEVKVDPFLTAASLGNGGEDPDRDSDDKGENNSLRLNESGACTDTENTAAEEDSLQLEPSDQVCGEIEEQLKEATNDADVMLEAAAELQPFSDGGVIPVDEEVPGGDEQSAIRTQLPASLSTDDHAGKERRVYINASARSGFHTTDHLLFSLGVGGAQVVAEAYASSEKEFVAAKKALLLRVKAEPAELVAMQPSTSSTSASAVIVGESQPPAAIQAETEGNVGPVAADDYYYLMMKPPVEYKPTAEEVRLIRRHKCSAAVWIPVPRDLKTVLERDREAQRQEKRRKERAARKEHRGGRERSLHKHSRHSIGRSSSPQARSSSQAPKASRLIFKKRSTLPVDTCCVCETHIDQESTAFTKSTLYCSLECIEKQVLMAKKCVAPGEIIMMVDMKGRINTSAKITISALHYFLTQNPNCRPVLNTHKLQGAVLKEDSDVAARKIENTRMNVQKCIRDSLLDRAKSSFVVYSAKRVKEMSEEIERELFTLHKGISPKYKQWCKAFVPKIKDPLNGYFRKILSSDVSIKRLVAMNPEEMVIQLSLKDVSVLVQPPSSTPSKTASQPDEAATAKATGDDDVELLDSSKSNQTTDATISRESSTVATSQQQPASTKYSTATQRFAQPWRRKRRANRQTKCMVDSILGDAKADTSHLHMFHLTDANCAICREKARRELEAKEKAERLEAEAQKKRAEEKDRPRRPNFPNLDAATREAMELNLPSSAGHLPISRYDHATNGYDAAGTFDYDDNYDAGENFDLGPENQLFIDETVDGGGPAPPLPHYTPHSTGSPFSEFTTKTPGYYDEPCMGGITPRDPFPRFPRGDSWKQSQACDMERGEEVERNTWLSRSQRIWAGRFSWGTRLQFDCSLLAISNPVAFKLDTELPEELKVVGKIKSVSMWDYVEQMKNRSRQIILFLLERPKDHEGKRLYANCYEVVRREGQYGVFGWDKTPENPCTNMYIFPLEPGEPLPRALIPLEGPGLPKGADANGVLLLVLIRRKDKEGSRQRAEECWRMAEYRKEEDRQGVKRRVEEAGYAPDIPADPDTIEDHWRPPLAKRSMGNECTPEPAAHNEAEAQFPESATSLGEENRMPESLVVEEATNDKSPELPDDEMQQLLFRIANHNEHPGDLLRMIGNYLNEHQISDNQRMLIFGAIQEKSERERHREFPTLLDQRQAFEEMRHNRQHDESSSESQRGGAAAERDDGSREQQHDSSVGHLQSAEPAPTSSGAEGSEDTAGKAAWSAPACSRRSGAPVLKDGEEGPHTLSTNRRRLTPSFEMSIIYPHMREQQPQPAPPPSTSYSQLSPIDSNAYLNPTSNKVSGDQTTQSQNAHSLPTQSLLCTEPLYPAGCTFNNSPSQPPPPHTDPSMVESGDTSPPPPPPSSPPPPDLYPEPSEPPPPPPPPTDAFGENSPILVGDSLQQSLFPLLYPPPPPPLPPPATELTNEDLLPPPPPPPNLIQETASPCPMSSWFHGAGLRFRYSSPQAFRPTPPHARVGIPLHAPSAHPDSQFECMLDEDRHYSEGTRGVPTQPTASVCAMESRNAKQGSDAESSSSTPSTRVQPLHSTTPFNPQPLHEMSPPAWKALHYPRGSMSVNHRGLHVARRGKQPRFPTPQHLEFSTDEHHFWPHSGWVNEQQRTDNGRPTPLWLASRGRGSGGGGGRGGRGDVL